MRISPSIFIVPAALSIAFLGGCQTVPPAAQGVDPLQAKLADLQKAAIKSRSSYLDNKKAEADALAAFAAEQPDLTKVPDVIP